MPFGYKYTNENHEQIYINPDPVNEYEINKSLRESSILDKYKKIKQNKIFNEMLQLKDNTIYIRTFENVTKTIEKSFNITFKTKEKRKNLLITSHILYFPDVSVTILNKKQKYQKTEVDIIRKNILLDNFTDEFKNISDNYANKLFGYGRENYLYTDITTYLNRRKNTENLDLLYIFNAIDLNVKRDYQIAMVSLTDTINNQTVYKIYNPLWNSINLLEETINLNNKDNKVMFILENYY